MLNPVSPIRYLLSLPPKIASEFLALTGHPSSAWFASSDPPEGKLGSGGGTAYLLQQAMRHDGETDFVRWLRQGRKLLIHGGGHSRRLPAYGPVGKPLIPLPVLRTAFGQDLSQTLLDLQTPAYEGLFRQAPQSSRVLIASGDVFI